MLGIEVVKEAESVEDSMIATQVHRVLLVALALVDIVAGVVDMPNKLMDRFMTGQWRGRLNNGLNY